MRACAGPAEACVPLSSQDIAPLEFALRDSRVSLAIAGAAISPPMVPKGAVCREVKVFPAECRGLRSTYRGKITVRFSSTPFFFPGSQTFWGCSRESCPVCGARELVFFRLNSEETTSPLPFFPPQDLNRVPPSAVEFVTKSGSQFRKS